MGHARRTLAVAGALIGGLALAITLTVLLSLHGVSFRVKPPRSGPDPASDQEIQQFIDKNRARLSEGSLLCPCGGYYFVDVNLFQLPVSFYLISGTESGGLVREVLPPDDSSYIHGTSRGYRQPLDPSLCGHVVIAQNATYLNLTNTYCQRLYEAVANYMGLHVRDVAFFNPRLFLNKIGRGIKDTSADISDGLLPASSSQLNDQQKVLGFVHTVWSSMLGVPIGWSNAHSDPQDSDYWNSIPRLPPDNNFYSSTAKQSGLDTLPQVSSNESVFFGMSVNWTQVYLSCGPSYCQDVDPKNPIMGLVILALFGGIFLFTSLILLLLVYFLPRMIHKRTFHIF